MRDIVDSPTKFALKRLIKSYRPNFILIVEHWMDRNLFPSSWLNLKFFAVNRMNDLNSNLWCLCDTNISHDVVFLDDQHISFTFE